MTKTNTNTRKNQFAVIYKFKEDQTNSIYHVETKDQAIAMATQLFMNDKIEFVNISDEVVL